MSVIDEVVAERNLHKEKYSAAYDDTHTDDELARAAACYAVGSNLIRISDDRHKDRLWPWEIGGMFTHHYRKRLLIAAALCIAEIERIDRLPPPSW